MLQKRAVRKIREAAEFAYSGVGAEHAYRELQEGNHPMESFGNKRTLERNMLLLMPNNSWAALITAGFYTKFLKRQKIHIQNCLHFLERLSEWSSAKIHSSVFHPPVYIHASKTTTSLL